MSMKKTNKLPMESILVITGDQVIPSGSFTTATTALNLQNGQLGILSMDPNSAVRTYGEYLRTGDDSTEVQAITLVQGTAASQATQNADIWEVGDPAYVDSGIIRRGNIRSVMVKQGRFASLGAQAVTTFPTPADDANYNAFLTLDSVRYEKEYGITNSNSLYASAPVVADFTSITAPLDYVLQYLIAGFNSQSKLVTTNTRQGNKNFVVLGVKVGGGSGQALGTITPTTSFTFQTVESQAQNMTSSVEFVQAIARLVQDSTLTNSSTIENVDISTAGAAAKVDALIVVGLPHTLAAYYDNVEQVMVTPQINLGGGFISTATDPVVTTAYAQEGTGHSTKWDDYNRWRAQLNVHTKQNQPVNDWFSEGKSYIDLAKSFYTSYIIEYYDTENTLTHQIQSPKKTILLFRSEPDSSFTVNVANVVTRIAANSTPIPFFTSNDAGTGTVSAVTVAQVEAKLTAWLEHARTTGTNFKVGGDAVAAGTYLA